MQFCRHIRLLFGKRLGTILPRQRIRKYPDLSVHVIGFEISFFFPLWRVDLKNTRIRVSTEAVSAKKVGLKNIRYMRTEAIDKKIKLVVFRM